MKALRQIPPVHEVLARPELWDLGPVTGEPFAARILRGVIDRLRARLHNDAGDPSREDLAREIAVEFRSRLEAFLSPSLCPVINATGVVLHTNLGRAPLPPGALEHVARVSSSYSNLEFELGEGRRGRRDSHVSDLVSELIGCESAIVVNNNAAAVLLVLNALAEGGEVLVSRGEEIEIGGSFRIPEVMEKSGARLREIGTTNRTRIADYERALGPETRLLLRVHPSNFTVSGFTERPALEEFADLGRRCSVPTFEDLGSGCVTDLGRLGIADEPRPQQSIAAGMDLVCFSGDKLLGGPQAGIIAGRSALVETARRNPLFRALRVDKMTLAALEWVLRAHLKGEGAELPVWSMLGAPESEIEDRARALARRVARAGIEPVRMDSVVGGGSVPQARMASWGVSVAVPGVSARAIESRLLDADPPVVARIEDDRLLLDLRTVSRSEEDALLRALERALTR